MPVQVPTVSVYAGDTIQWPVYTIRTPDNVARDLVAEGWGNWRAQWRVNEDSTTLIELNVDDSRADEGMLVITATSEMTDDMDGPGVFDLQATRGDEVKTWVRGKTKYTKDVTRVG